MVIYNDIVHHEGNVQENCPTLNSFFSSVMSDHDSRFCVMHSAG